jgi:hypothetical protein
MKPTSIQAEDRRELQLESSRSWQDRPAHRHGHGKLNCSALFGSELEIPGDPRAISTA